jgi:putative flippase GtrA
VKAIIQRLKDSVIFRFALAGTAGFLTDGTILQAGISLVHLSPLIARIPSFSVAVVVTWWLNRDFTFRTPEKSFRDSFPAYLLSSAVGLAINFGVYTAGVLMHVWPLPALAAASIAAMFFNFAMARFVIFGKKD